MATKSPTLTIKQVCAGFGGISTVCLNHWRAGTPTKEALEVEKNEETGKVAIKESVVIKWAKKHELEFDLKAAYKAGDEPIDKVAVKKASTKPVAKKAAAKKAPTKKPVAKSKPRSASQLKGMAPPQPKPAEASAAA